jgi:hypothetical protein
MLIHISPSWRKNKSYAAFYSDRPTIHFGRYYELTEVADKNLSVKLNHQYHLSKYRGFNLDNPFLPSTLDYFIIWGSRETIEENIAYYKEIYQL